MQQVWGLLLRLLPEIHQPPVQTTGRLPGDDWPTGGLGTCTCMPVSAASAEISWLKSPRDLLPTRPTQACAISLQDWVLLALSSALDITAQIFYHFLSTRKEKYRKMTSLGQVTPFHLPFFLLSSSQHPDVQMFYSNLKMLPLKTI